MSIAIRNYYGAYSNVPLRIDVSMLKQSLINDGIIYLRFKYRVLSGGVWYNKEVRLRRRYHISDLDAVEVDIAPILRDVVSGGDVMDIHRNYFYYGYVDIVFRYSYRNDDGFEGEVEEVTYRQYVYPSNFTIYNLSDADGVRLCKPFFNFNTNSVIKPYTTLFKNYEVLQLDNYMVRKVEEFNGMRLEYIDTVVKPRKGVGNYNRVVDGCGVFMAWRNDAGTMSYWLFSNDYTEEVKTKGLGTAVVGYNKEYGMNANNVEHFGFTATRTWTLHSLVPVMQEEWDEVMSVLVSRHVWVWDGDDEFVQNEEKFWRRVRVLDGSYKCDVNGQRTYSFSITIELEAYNTRRGI